ncbi:hypothetical protein [Hymenobacter sp. YC55]|uniref:hypothetical protein n=1 Tax=Hymenobacter sp. YC55 TaxID=3034019 RepID=UPI0023F810C6|nr:hypothetical protein [Hymenobacter sp. YC55]MDF7813887.1 hypothetical protein [Hymenobacter sp. YC55]
MSQALDLFGSEAAAATGAKAQLLQLVGNLVFALSSRPTSHDQRPSLTVGLVGMRILWPGR